MIICSSENGLKKKKGCKDLTHTIQSSVLIHEIRVSTSYNNSDGNSNGTMKLEEYSRNPNHSQFIFLPFVSGNSPFSQTSR